MFYYAYNVLCAPIARDLGLSSRFVAGAFSLTLFLAGTLARPVGRALDERGARPVLLLSAVVGPLAFAAFAVVRHELTLLLAFAALGIAQSLALYEPAFRAIVQWFPVERERSRALLVLTSVAGFASTAFLPLTALLVERCGWRWTVLILASLAAAVTIPVRLCIPAKPGAARGDVVETAGSAARSIVENLLGAGFALQSFASTGATVYLVWHLVEQGEPLGRAAVIAGLAGAAQVPGRLLLAPLQRALRTAVRLPLLFLVQAGALSVVALGSGSLVHAAILLFGAAGGAMTLERASVTLEWFGRDDFGTRSGRIASIAFVARAASPFGVELLHGTGSYAGAFAMLAASAGGGALAIVFANRFRAK